jgi:hypothetical protein
MLARFNPSLGIKNAERKEERKKEKTLLSTTLSYEPAVTLNSLKYAIYLPHSHL